jgi:hypothetical protein
MLFSTTEGRKISDFVRKIELDMDDDRYEKVGVIDKIITEEYNTYFFAGWKITQVATPSEKNHAEIFRYIPQRFFEPCGEECGTRYDESAACPLCKSGAPQLDPLILNTSRLPKSDFAESIGSEMVVSRRVVDSFTRNGVTGVTFVPVLTGRKRLVSDHWFQFIVDSTIAEIVPPTRSGNGPFDEDPQNLGRCPTGHLLGLNLLSDVTISRQTFGDLDVFASRQFFGVRRGLLQPHRIVFMSQKVRKIIETEKLKGCRLEVAFLS